MEIIVKSKAKERSLEYKNSKSAINKWKIIGLKVRLKNGGYS